MPIAFDHLRRRVSGIGRDTWNQIRKANLLQVASSLAFITILSIIPLLAVSFAIFNAFGGMKKLYDVIEPFIISNLAQGTSDEVIARIHGFIDNIHVSTVGVGGLIALIFTSMSMLASIERAINQVWDARVTRKWFARISSYWLFITLGPLALSVAVGVATSHNLPLSHVIPEGPGVLLIAIAVFYCVYKFVPNARVEWEYALVSSCVTSVLWHLARAGFTFYAKRAIYNNIYGSLAAVPILLLWIYVVWVVILSGAALTATLQKRFESGQPQKIR